MTTTAGHSFYIGPIVFFYYQVNDTGSWEDFPIGIKNRRPSNDHSWAVWFQLSKWFQRRSILKHVFYADRKSKMAVTAGHRLTLDPMGKCLNAFFSETTNMIKAKLYMNVHWMVLYKLQFHIGTKNLKFVEDHPMNIHVQFGFNHICSFWEEGIWTFSHRVQC
jgi:hypothetical protein